MASRSGPATSKGTRAQRSLKPQEIQRLLNSSDSESEEEVQGESKKITSCDKRVVAFL